MPSDWFAYFNLAGDTRGLSFVGAYGDTGGGKIRNAALYKIEPVRRQKPPNIVLVVIDGLRPDRVGVQAPGTDLEALAAKGVRFSRVVSPSPRATGSLMSIFTSLYPEVHVTSSDAPGSHEKVGGKITTLPEVLKERGYRTAGFYERGNFNRSAGFDRGMDVWEDCSDEAGQATSAKVLQWAAADKGKPFFLFLSTRPRDYLFAAPRDPGLFYDLQKEVVVDSYNKEINHIGGSIKEFIEALEGEGLLDDTLVIITGNRGKELWEHGSFDKPSLYAENSLVPLVLYWPGHVPAGKVVNAQVRLIDLMPTIIDFAGAEMPGQVQGASLRPYLFGKADSDLFAASEEMLDANRWYALEYGMRDGKWFYYFKRDPKDLSADYREELYDERDDPGEQIDLVKRVIIDPKLLKEKDGSLQILKNQLWMHYLQNQRMSHLLW
jgi:arylsulfatase A-like enzyme